MGREIRRVPLDWVAPSTPHFDETVEEAHQDWLSDTSYGECQGLDADAYGPDPYENPEYYRPAWPEGTTLGYQVYENVSEGSPISPVFANHDELFRWLTQKDGAPGMGIGGSTLKMTREQAQRFIENEYAVSMVMDASGIRSGLEI